MRGVYLVWGGGVDERRAGFFRIDRFARMKKPLATNLFPEKYFRQRRLKPKSHAPDFIQGRGFFFLKACFVIDYSSSTHGQSFHFIICIHCMSNVRSSLLVSRNGPEKEAAHTYQEDTIPHRRKEEIRPDQETRYAQD